MFNKVYLLKTKRLLMDRFGFAYSELILNQFMDMKILSGLQKVN